MSEIWNLNALCRCCHSDGLFKSLRIPYMYEGSTEVYSEMLSATIGVKIEPPSLDASYTICDICIEKLRHAAQFKKQVLECEQKFDEYCKNEQAFYPTVEDIKVESDIFQSDDRGEDSDGNFESDLITTKDKDLTFEQCKIEEGDFTYSCRVNIPKRESQDTRILNCVKTKKEDKLEHIKKERDSLVIRSDMIKRKTNTKRSSKAVNNKIDKSLIVRVKTEGLQSYACKICGEGFINKLLIKHHVKNEHMTGPHKCKYCGKIFDMKKRYNAHIKAHKDKLFKCSHCNKSYHTKKMLQDHENIHTKQRVYICDHCEKVFIYKTSLRRHVLIHIGKNKQHMCDICGRYMNDLTNLKIHINVVHEKLRLFSCDICHKTFTANKHLKIHYRKHTGEIPYKCEECPKAFRDWSSLRDHKQRHKNIDKSGQQYNYCCKYCKLLFNERGALVKHVRASHVYENQCELCGKDFSTKYSLNRHMNDHYGIKLFKCDICETAFSQKSLLVRHISRHHDPLRRKKVPCTICKKEVYNLEKHIEAHSTKPYGCDRCERRYTANSALNRHIRIVHLGYKPFVCQMCGKEFVKVGSLRKHKLKAHNIKEEPGASHYNIIDHISTGNTFKLSPTCLED